VIPTLSTQDRNAFSDRANASSSRACRCLWLGAQLKLGVDRRPVRLEIEPDGSIMRVGFGKQTSQVTDERTQVIGADVKAGDTLDHPIPHRPLV
jgi:hypothetical protein